MSDSGEQPERIEIVLLDEQPLLRQGIKAYLNSQPDMIVSGEAETISDARRKIVECAPQLLVTALGLGTEDSLKLIKKLKAENPGLRVLVYSAFEENIFAMRALRAGANGYVMKQAPTEKLATAIREIAKGNIYVSREVAVSVFRKTLGRRPKNNRVLRSAAYIQDLSDREIHIFQLLGSGLGPREIAASLNLSIKTVETHQENIKHKLQLRSCAELRERAAKWVQRSLSTGEYLFRGIRQRKVRSMALRVVEAFDAQRTSDSQVAPDTAATAGQ